METKRVPVVGFLENRNGTLTKDGVMDNCYVEDNPEGTMAVKRPGLAFLASLGVLGQGAGVYNSLPVFIVDDTLVTGGHFVNMTATTHAGGA